MDFIIQFALYLGRWQLSTLTLWPCMELLKKLPTLRRVVIANLIGGAIFFFVDRQIFGK